MLMCSCIHKGPPGIRHPPPVRDAKRTAVNYPKRSTGFSARIQWKAHAARKVKEAVDVKRVVYALNVQYNRHPRGDPL